MYKNSHNGNYQLRITVEMVDRRGLDVIALLFGGRWYSKPNNPPRRARYVWMTFNSEAESALRELSEYMRVKRDHALVALEADWSGFIGRPLPREQKDARERVANRIKEMNARGYQDADI